VFRQFVRAEIAAGLDETYRFEDWAAGMDGAAYYDVHVSVIERYETAVPTLRRVLGDGGRILESGCGTGRWMAFFERLGLRAVGVDDSAGPLAVARAHDPALRLVRGDVIASPFRADSFDAAFSAYVAEHFVDGPGALLRELHRVLKPDGLLVVVVPYESWFRRLVTHRVLGAYYWWARRRGRPLAFTEHRFRAPEMTGYLTRSGFRVEHIEADDYRLPWGKGLSVDCGPLLRPRGQAPGSWELNAPGRVLAAALQAVSPWAACAGILLVARAVK
jgi:SAM-dependent methyltransferase